MKSTSSPLPAPVPQRISFAQATPEQRARAEEYVREELAAQFPPVLKGTWAGALQALQPDLWATSDRVGLDVYQLDRVADHLDALPAVVHARAGHGPRKLYFGRLPMNCPDEVLRALAELEADPQAGGHAVYQLVAGVARRHAEAEQFGWSKSPAPREADGTDSDQARAGLLARVAALDRARGLPTDT
ncbi:hypothetical protein [Hymenobacter arizonensis]|uniref:Uncharacterized protein n=1 Tax=Hymenobacter arizonensis TaxID=1227077 RepID=A0A1I6BQA9_HYMAR|nr:hypothetical protein [Hymenobacter arizonensis]SFQ83103.1 hypothetical protein SAMN04515668_4907 [Hymenobacter arizonensis]